MGLTEAGLTEAGLTEAGLTDVGLTVGSRDDACHKFGARRLCRSGCALPSGANCVCVAQEFGVMSLSATSSARRLRHGRHPLWGLGRLAQLLLVLPFVLLSMMAPGTMAATGADGEVHIVICAGDGPVDMVMLEDGSLRPASEETPGHGAPHDTCAWAVHAQPVLSFLPDEAMGPILRVTPAVHFVHVAQHHRRRAVLAPTARGPPGAGLV